MSAREPSAAGGAAEPGGPPDDPLIGAILGDRYHIESYLEGGGMGIVYRARHIVLDKPLAVKVMRQAKDDLSQQRFLLEAKSACQINHEHIVDITDYGVLDDGRPYLVMELLQGRPLDSLIAKGPLAPRRACLIGEQIAYGLQVVHDKGILHRDLKPSNVFLLDRRGQDFIKILDFGIAKVTGVKAAGSGPGANRQTHEGTVLGTPEYMAPEQALGEAAEPRSDQYSLGCILYEMLTGAPPCLAPTPMLVLVKHINGEIVAPRTLRPDLQIPASLEAVVMRALSRQREQRFPSMHELAMALQHEGALLPPADSSGMLSAPSLAAGLAPLTPSSQRLEPTPLSLAETQRRGLPAALRNLPWPPKSRSGRVLISSAVTLLVLLGALLLLWRPERRAAPSQASAPSGSRAQTGSAAPPPAAVEPPRAAANGPAPAPPATAPTDDRAEGAAAGDAPEAPRAGETESDGLRILFANGTAVPVTITCPGQRQCSAASKKSCELRVAATATGRCEASARGYQAQTYPLQSLRSKAKNGRARQAVQLDARGLGQLRL